MTAAVATETTTLYEMLPDDLRDKLMTIVITAGISALVQEPDNRRGYLDAVKDIVDAIGVPE